MPLDSSKFTRLAQFHTTRWSVVVRAQSPATGAADEPLESLCRQYWPPLYAYVRGRGQAMLQIDYDGGVRYIVSEKK